MKSFIQEYGLRYVLVLFFIIVIGVVTPLLNKDVANVLGVIAGLALYDLIKHFYITFKKKTDK